MTMTWGEFKTAVEQANVKDSTEIWFIDISFPLGPNDIQSNSEYGSLNISEDPKVGLAISN